MKKTVSIFFLSLFITYSVGVNVYYWYFQQAIKKEYLQSLSCQTLKEKTIVIRIDTTNKEFLHVQDENEISFDNKMYDVLRTESKGDATYYYCLSDEDESTAINLLSSEYKVDFDKNLTSKSNHAKSVNKHFTKDYLVSKNIEFISFKETSPLFTVMTFPLQEAVIAFVIPPPQV